MQETLAMAYTQMMMKQLNKQQQHQTPQKPLVKTQPIIKITLKKMPTNMMALQIVITLFLLI